MLTHTYIYSHSVFPSTCLGLAYCYCVLLCILFLIHVSIGLCTLSRCGFSTRIKVLIDWLIDWVGSGKGCAPSQKIYEFFISKWCDMVQMKMAATCGIQKFRRRGKIKHLSKYWGVVNTGRPLQVKYWGLQPLRRWRLCIPLGCFRIFRSTNANSRARPVSLGQLLAPAPTMALL